MKLFVKILSLVLSLTMFITNVVFADTVILSNAPYSNATTNNGILTSQVVNTTVNASDKWNGPAGVPSDGTVVGFTNSIGATGVNQATSGGTSGVVYTNPTTKNITSPAANNAKLTNNQSTIINPNGLTNNNLEGVTYRDPEINNIISPGDHMSKNGSGYTSSSNNNGPSYEQTAPGDTGKTSADSSYEGISSSGNTNVSNASSIATSVAYTPNNSIATAKPSISATAGIVVDATAKQILYYKNPYTPYAPASLTNMMTAYLLYKYKGLDTPLTVSQRAVTSIEKDASTAGLRAGDTILAKDAIAAMFIRNCCDVANVAAENVSGTLENFVALMNQTAKQLGMVSTNFVNPSGLPNDAHVTSPYDIAVLTDVVTQDPSLLYLMSLTKYTLPATAHRKALTLTTKNTLVTQGSANYYTGAQASRMGYTSKSLYTISTLMPYNNHRVIAVVMHANGSQFSDTKKLLNFAQAGVNEIVTNGTVNGALNQNIQNQMLLQQQLLQQQQAAQNTANANANSLQQQQLLLLQQQAAQAAQNNQGLQYYTSTSTAAQAQNAINSAQQSLQAIVALTGLTSDTPGTWGQDATGYYFLKSNGTKAVNEWVQSNSKIYCMDSNGYMITGFKDFSNGKRYYFDTTTGELRYNTWVNTATGGYYLQQDGSVAKADAGTTKNITTSVGTYTIDQNGRAIAKVS